MVMLVDDRGWRGFGQGGTVSELMDWLDRGAKGPGSSARRTGGSPGRMAPGGSNNRRAVGRDTGTPAPEYTGPGSPGWRGAQSWTPPWANTSSTTSTSYQGRPGSPAATNSTYARTPSSSSNYPRSADAAAVWAAGERAGKPGVVAIRDEQESILWDPQNPNSIYARMRGKEYVGIADNNEFIRNKMLPFLGYDAKAGIYGMPYQLPEYTVDEVGATLQRMTPDELADFRAKAIAAGLWDPDVYPSDYGVTEEDIRIMSSLMAQANYSKATSWEALLFELEQNPNMDLGEAGGGGSAGFQPSTLTEKVYSKTSMEAGRSYIRAYMTELLGRGPTDDEVRRYVANLNRVESEKPQIVETSRTMGDNENDIIETTKTVQNAPMPSEFLYGQVEDDEATEGEQFTYQAQGYFDRLLEVI